jgi:hypothetical protein
MQSKKKTCECGLFGNMGVNDKKVFVASTERQREMWGRNGTGFDDRDTLTWHELASSYSTLKLTFGSDKLPAFSGIASQLRRRSSRKPKEVREGALFRATRIAASQPYSCPDPPLMMNDLRGYCVRLQRGSCAAKIIYERVWDCYSTSRLWSVPLLRLDPSLYTFSISYEHESDWLASTAAIGWGIRKRLAGICLSFAGNKHT